METVVRKGLPVSKLTVGTVQFGLPYGLNQDAIPPSAAEAGEILSCAFAKGCTAIDTAAAYGDSEEKIGSWIRSEKTAGQAVVVTKVHDLDHSSEAALIRSMRDAVLRSRRNLCLDTVPVVMVHHFDEYLEHKGSFDKAFGVLKDEGLIRCSGVSAYSSDDYIRIAESGLDAVQIPLNLLDWEQILSGGLAALSRAGVIVFARSVYLQGLLLRKPEDLRPEMSFAADTLRRYIDLCRAFGCSQKELAVSFALSMPGVSSIVAGCRNMAQVLENCSLIENCKLLSDEQTELLRAAFSETDRRIVDPSLWHR